MAIRIGNRVRKVMGVVQSGTVIPIVPVSKYSDGSYRAPYNREYVVYVKWDDGTVGWVNTTHVMKEKK